jgi:hypothetical protein
VDFKRDTMPEVMIEQALLVRRDEDVEFIAKSAAFPPVLLPDVQRIALEFGPARFTCHFVQPLADFHIAVAEAFLDRDRAAGTIFRILIVPKKAYQEIVQDPWRLIDHFFGASIEERSLDQLCRTELPTLTWASEPAPRRMVNDIQAVLRHGDAPLLLGAAQALVDGARIVLERETPDRELLRGLWLLLPNRMRWELWPATYVGKRGFAFNAFIVPPGVYRRFPDCLIEKQIYDYPEARYERSLQVAVESGDQNELDRLFARRTAAQTLRLGLAILVGVLALALIMRLMNAMLQPAINHPPPAATAR